MADNTDDLSPEGSVNYIEERNHLLRDIPYSTVKRAWFTLSHLILDEGSRVVDMGCGEGEMTYAMAALNPRLKFIGVDKSKRNINKARQTYKLHNLEFKLGDVASDLFKPETIDCVLNNFILHEVFSGARYNEQIISDTLRKHYKMLKNNGLLFIRDYARPPAGEYVLMEMHDRKSYGRGVEELSEADLLVWYSEHARPKQDPGCGGFFLEELPPRFPKTRLFRLPYKWAYEFMMRKDRRTDMTTNLLYEYTFFTPAEFKRELRHLGARVEYSAPHWDEDYINDHFAGHFRLMNLNGDAMGDPSTSFVSIARKLPERVSLDVKERRISGDEGDLLKIRTLRDQKNGSLLDIVTRGKEIAEVIPYRMSDGRLNIFLHDGLLRGLVNAVPRAGINIDGREWSGHMIEPIAVDHYFLREIKRDEPEDVAAFCDEFIGIKPADKETLFEDGPAYYPDPNRIDERIHTIFLNAHYTKTPLQPKTRILQSHHFQAKGSIREVSAQLVLDAIGVGLIPNSRLELQILALMQRLKVRAENWTSKQISVERGDVTKRLNLRDYLQQVSNSNNRFKEVKGSAGQIKTVNSIFVEEGQNQGGRTGLSAQNIDFFLPEDETINTAVILPITISARGDLHAGFQLKHMPIPQRYEGKSLTISAPQFNIPKDVTNMKMLKQFVAERLSATPEMVIKLGESYFTHIGVTPHRIYPFALAAPPNFYKDPNTKFMPFYQYMLLWKSLSADLHLMTVIARAYRYLPDHMRLAAKKEINLVLDEIFQKARPDWSVPSSIEPPVGRNEDTKKEKNKASGTAQKAMRPNDTQGPSENIEDPHKRREKERKERRERKKMGIEQKITDPDEDEDAFDSGDPESMEGINQKREAATRIDMKLVEEFKNEIETIKNLVKDEDDGPKLEGG